MQCKSKKISNKVAFSSVSFLFCAPKRNFCAHSASTLIALMFFTVFNVWRKKKSESICNNTPLTSTRHSIVKQVFRVHFGFSSSFATETRNNKCNTPKDYNQSSGRHEEKRFNERETGI